MKWVKVTQSYPTLCNPMDYTGHRILQARILEWEAVPFSRGSLQPRNWTGISCIAGWFFTNRGIREACVNEVIDNVFFCTWLLLLNYVCKIHYISACEYSFFILMSAVYFIVWLYHSSFIYFEVNGHLGCFQFSAIMNNVASVLAYVFWLIFAHIELLGHSLWYL